MRMNYLIIPKQDDYCDHKWKGRAIEVSIKLSDTGSRVVQASKATYEVTVLEASRLTAPE